MLPAVVTSEGRSFIWISIPTSLHELNKITHPRTIHFMGRRSIPERNSQDHQTGQSTYMKTNKPAYELTSVFLCLSFQIAQQLNSAQQSNLLLAQVPLGLRPSFREGCDSARRPESQGIRNPVEMATLSERRLLIWDLQKKLLALNVVQLRAVASALDDGQGEKPVDTSSFTEPELYDFIMDFAKSEKLRSLEDEGLSRLLFLNDAIDDMLKNNDSTPALPGSALPAQGGDSESTPLEDITLTQPGDASPATHTETSTTSRRASKLSTASDQVVTDDFLLEQITKSANEEAERLKRLGTVTKARPVTLPCDTDQVDCSKLTTSNKEEDNHTAIVALTAQVSALTKHLEKMSQTPDREAKGGTHQTLTNTHRTPTNTHQTHSVNTKGRTQSCRLFEEKEAGKRDMVTGEGQPVTSASKMSQVQVRESEPTPTPTPCDVKMGKKGLTIPAGQICEVKCRVRAWPGGGTMLFEPATENNRPEGLELFPALVDVPCGPSKVVKIPIQNSTKHSIYLPQRTVLGQFAEVTEWTQTCEEKTAGSSETAEQDSVNSDEEEYSYRLRKIPVYERRQVRSQTAQPETQSRLRVSASEFQPVWREPVEREPVVTPESVQEPAQPDVCPMEEIHEESEVDDGNQEEVQEVEAVSEAGQHDAEQPAARRSSRAAKPREVFTYNSFGQPSYQSWRPGANAVFQYEPYFMPGNGMACQVIPEACYYPRQNKPAYELTSVFLCLSFQIAQQLNSAQQSNLLLAQVPLGLRPSQLVGQTEGQGPRGRACQVIQKGLQASPGPSQTDWTLGWVELHTCGAEQSWPQPKRLMWRVVRVRISRFGWGPPRQDTDRTGDTHVHASLPPERRQGNTRDVAGRAAEQELQKTAGEEKHEHHVMAVQLMPESAVCLLMD
ncbi:hypothetical protein N1851_006677 [Merluccius polli]|uniref:Uncharacterized protein n=1 Tax=Merluccius polli TaxID=89951 RepID=A0AA47N3Z1_MERPO|nr:hypothetical protein N1851_006677 [Merluccius polli]